MFDVCPKCGEFREDKIIDPDGSFAICPNCTHAHPFVMQPLFVLTGASGTGKSTIGLSLLREPEIIALEVDIFWRQEFATPDNDFYDFRNLCLRVAKNIQQNGRPVLLCGSATPGQYEKCVQARYFSHIHYLALVCDNAILEQRLTARPAWRESGKREFIEAMLAYNQWFRDNENHPNYHLTTLDTTNLTVAASVEHVRKWYLARLS
jgi:gluconate kinase